MDTLSSTVSTLKIPPPLPPTNREFYNFKRIPHATLNRSPQPPPHVSSTSIPNLHHKTKPPFSHKRSSTSPPFSSSNSSSTLPHKPSSIIFHENPSTGYAAAILDVAQTTNSLHLVQKDVHKLLQLLQHVNLQSTTMVNDPSMVEELKGQAMRHVVKHGKFHRHVAVFLKMLMKKDKMGILQQVLEEFERIYDEICGTQVVLVSSTTKMGEDEVFGIAKRVQNLSGAVRVKVRNLVQERVPSFAV